MAADGEGMTQSVHGGNVYKVARERRIPVERIVDFSASINPLGFPMAGLRAIRAALKRIVHYPDPDCWKLREVLAQQCGVDPEMILVGNGSTELIHLLPRVLELESTLIIGPTFEEYAHASINAGGSVQYVHAKREDGFLPPLKDVLQQLFAKRPRFDAVFLCNPNNPTGQVMSRADVCELTEAVDRQQGWLIVDEAFIDYCQAHSAVSMLREYPRMLMLRSLTKFYAMPGLRIGYLIGASKVIERMKDRQPPWSVNSLVQEASCAVLHDEAFAARSRAFMEKERVRFECCLRALSGIRIFPSDANFVLIELPASISADEVRGRMASKQLLVRDCSQLPGLSSQMIRVAIRTARENRRLITALGGCLKG